MTIKQYLRYVAIGDSQTEGVGDGDDASGLRGWADRLADSLAAANPGLTYANLAVRGRLAQQIHAEQLAPALALAPDLVTVVAGMNDLLRPRCDIDAVAGHLDAMFAALTGAGATVATLTFPEDIGRLVPLAAPLAPRLVAINSRIRAAALRHGVIVAETANHPVVTDPRLWSADRLHASPLGHTRIAAAMAEALEVPGSDDSWTRPLPVTSGRRNPAIVDEARWAAAFLGPWLVRRLRGRSSGDGRTAKRPSLLPVQPAN
ncbi:MAG TPA: SGNH/GDSL hydrolase family protein [Pseudonocardiaceae bacterium]